MTADADRRDKQESLDVPNDVVGVRRIDDADYEGLGRLSRLTARVHGMVTAYPPRGDDRRARGLCMVACAEQAIVLTRLG